MSFTDLFGLFNSTPPIPTQSASKRNGFTELSDKIDAVCHATGVDPARIEAKASDNGLLPDEIMSLIHKGQKIQAIKAYRDLTDAGLKEAKDAIDAAEAGTPTSPFADFAILHAKLDAVLAKLEAGR